MLTKKRKKVLIVTRNLPPLIGGMERLNWHIADELSQVNRVEILSHTDARNLAPKDCLFHSVPLNPLPIFLLFAFIKTFWICLTLRPDILFAGSGLTAPITVFWAKVFRKKSVVYIHGLDIGTNHKLYNLLWIPFIKKANVLIANSSATYNICIKKGIKSTKLKIIPPGVSFPPQPRNMQLIQQLKEQYQLNGKKVLISVGRLTQRKGLNEFIDYSFPKIVKNIPNVVLIVIGDTPNQSLKKTLQSKELILSTAQKHNVHDRIIFIGNINDDQILSSFYYLTDIHIFPVKYIPDDPEGFGMVAIEAAAHGTPTIAFATGGIIDAVEHQQTGFLVEKENYNEFSEKVVKLLLDESLISQPECKNYTERFSWPNLSKKINKILE
ncbi:glycosyltransferase family 4 protein [Acinetobacter rongchengensis]|uniref:Glycosyltransferase family 1 protein n=1 Tax=Acinetobacter rongchengensis TaxID=2419601 RepID=A0A3A8EV52_9GAMM|nr:glycosyltransferase family 4 protein [Acinetobacter rongchengensis]RKG38058.1 glycosyltransferase family 1 protein [Acinetobacter rongchengensis]